MGRSNLNDKKKIQQLEARNEHLELTVSDLRKQIEMILKREVTVCVMKQLSEKEAREGFDYPT
jgi:cell division protein FtsB